MGYVLIFEGVEKFETVDSNDPVRIKQAVARGFLKHLTEAEIQRIKEIALGRPMEEFIARHAHLLPSSSVHGNVGDIVVIIFDYHYCVGVRPEFLTFVNIYNEGYDFKLEGSTLKIEHEGGIVAYFEFLKKNKTAN